MLKKKSKLFIQGIDKTWVVDPPEMVPYKSLYSEASTEEDETGRIVVITLSVLFVVVIICCLYEVYRSDKQYRRRKEMETDEMLLRSKEQAEKMQAMSFKQVLFIINQTGLYFKVILCLDTIRRRNKTGTKRKSET